LGLSASFFLLLAKSLWMKGLSDLKGLNFVWITYRERLLRAIAVDGLNC